MPYKQPNSQKKSKSIQDTHINKKPVSKVKSLQKARQVLVKKYSLIFGSVLAGVIILVVIAFSSFTSSILNKTSASNLTTDSFTDVTKLTTYYEQIIDLAKEGVIHGYGNGTYGPYDNSTRGELAKTIKNTLFGKNYSNLRCSKFPDVGRNNTFYVEITTLKCEGIVDGYPDGTFRPNAKISIGETMKLAFNNSKYVPSPKTLKNYDQLVLFKENPASDTFSVFLKRALENGSLDEDYPLDLSKYIDRAQMANLIHRARKPNQDKIIKWLKNPIYKTEGSIKEINYNNGKVKVRFTNPYVYRKFVFCVTVDTAPKKDCKNFVTLKNTDIRFNSEYTKRNKYGYEIVFNSNEINTTGNINIEDKFVEGANVQIGIKSYNDLGEYLGFISGSPRTFDTVENIKDKEKKAIQALEKQLNIKIPKLEAKYTTGNGESAKIGYTLNSQGKVSHLNLLNSKVKTKHLVLISNFTSLKYLNLGENQITKTEVLGNLTSLEWLNLSVNQITKIEGLGKLTKLEILYLGENKITKIEGVSSLVSLKKLNLDNNQITKIEGLNSLTSLQILNLSKNQITKIEGLDKLTKLQKLYLDYNQITKIEGLDTLVDLQSLGLTNNQITDAVPLKSLLLKQKTANKPILNILNSLTANPLPDIQKQEISKGSESFLEWQEVSINGQ